MNDLETIANATTAAQRRSFTEAMASGVRPEHALKVAGLGQNPKLALILMQFPEIQEGLRLAAEATLYADALPAAVNVLVKALRTRRTDIKLRADIALKVIAIAGFVPPKAGEASDPDAKPLAQRSRDELLDLAHAAKRELSERATKVVDSTVTRQSGAQPSAKHLDLLR